MSEKEKKENIEETKPIENLLFKGWNDFVSSITEGYNKFQKSIEEITSENTESWNQNQEKINKFLKDAKENWDVTITEWGTEFKKTHKDNKELWDNNLGKINAFFKNTQETWDNKIKEWTVDLEKRQIENKEQWEARKQKINLDINNWHKQTKRDWEKGLKSFRREMIKGSYMFLVYMIPILVVFVIIMYYLTKFLPQ